MITRRTLRTSQAYFGAERSATTVIIEGMSDPHAFGPHVTVFRRRRWWALCAQARGPYGHRGIAQASTHCVERHLCQWQCAGEPWLGCWRVLSLAGGAIAGH